MIDVLIDRLVQHTLGVAGPDVVYSTDGMSQEEEQALSAA